MQGGKCQVLTGNVHSGAAFFLVCCQLQLCWVLAGVSTSNAWTDSIAKCLNVHIGQVLACTALSGICRCYHVRYLQVLLYQVFARVAMSGTYRYCSYVRYLQIQPSQVLAGAALSCICTCYHVTYLQVLLYQVFAGSAKSGICRRCHIRSLQMNPCQVLAGSASSGICRCSHVRSDFTNTREKTFHVVIKANFISVFIWDLMYTYVHINGPRNPFFLPFVRPE